MKSCLTIAKLAFLVALCMSGCRSSGPMDDHPLVESTDGLGLEFDAVIVPMPCSNPKDFILELHIINRSSLIVKIDTSWVGFGDISFGLVQLTGEGCDKTDFVSYYSLQSRIVFYDPIMLPPDSSALISKKGSKLFVNFGEFHAPPFRPGLYRVDIYYKMELIESAKVKIL